MGTANGSADALRWSKGVKIIAIGWLGLLFSAWLHGEITAGFAFGAIASGVYWTVGSFLESAARMMRTHERHRTTASGQAS